MLELSFAEQSIEIVTACNIESEKVVTETTEVSRMLTKIQGRDNCFNKSVTFGLPDTESKMSVFQTTDLISVNEE